MESVLWIETISHPTKPDDESERESWVFELEFNFGRNLGNIHDAFVV